MREAAAGRQALEVRQVHPAGPQVGHVHVHGGEAGPVEGGGHLHLAVDPLLAQHGHLRAHAGGDEGGGDVLLGIGQGLPQVVGHGGRRAGTGCM
jgi:hypothetical protein